MHHNECPQCRKSLHYSSGWDEYMCLECWWLKGEPDCDTNYRPENLYTLSDWQTIVGLLYQQYKNKTLTYEHYCHIVEFEIGLL